MARRALDLRPGGARPRRNRIRVSDADFDRLVRNVYKVLLTRGMVGTVICSTDAATREALRQLTAPSAERE